MSVQPSKPFILSSYRRFQLMRFSVEEINNSTNLLPNVSLGYEIFDHCSDTQNFPGILKLISVNGLIQPWGEPQNLSKLIAVVGTYTSTETRTVAPLFMMDFIPMVSYGATSSVFSRKWNFPSFLRTAHPNKDIIEVIVNTVQHFNWRWVAFLNVDDDYGNDGLKLFIKMIKDTEICLAYTKGLNYETDYSRVFKQIEAQKIRVIIVFATEWTVEPLIESAIELNITNKVWIAVDAWSLNKQLSKKKGIKNIGTVLGVAVPAVTIPGFSDFVYASKSQNHCENAKQQMFCNQVCNCTNQSAQAVIDADPSFSFSVYSAVYAIAHALHNVLQCGAGRCVGNTTVYPHMVLTELKKSNFTLLNQSIEFDQNGDPKYGSYSIVFWNQSGDAEKVGFYNFHPSFHFFINSSKIQWHTKGEVPTSLCSSECDVGYAKRYDGIHRCCFNCEICPNGTYVNSTENPSKCVHCKETEWSKAGSTLCNLRVVEYVPFTDTGAILIMVGAWAFVGLTLAMSVLFAINYNTPVVRSAGGPMCFLILGCLSLCSLSVFFHFGKPTLSFCILRFLPFLLLFSVCLACFVVRAFQIVCIFRIAAKFHKLGSWWMKYHVQWLIITVAFVTQALLLVIGYSYAQPQPYNETVWYKDKIILGCDINLKAYSGSLVLLLFLCSLCFIFSYMGKHLPKNYNEAKAITFCLFLLILTWIIFATIYMLYRGKHIPTLKAVAVLFSIYSFLLFYFLPKCYIIIFQSYKNTQQYFQSVLENYTKRTCQ
ncbi:taste receptor type 1 member 1-like [Symphorus nematophorus]